MARKHYLRYPETIELMLPPPIGSVDVEWIRVVEYTYSKQTWNDPEEFSYDPELPEDITIDQVKLDEFDLDTQVAVKAAITTFEDSHPFEFDRVSDPDEEYDPRDL